MPNAGSGGLPPDGADGSRHEIAALRRSRRRLAEAGFADRRAIERDLHDGIQQHLVGLAVDLQRLARVMDSDPAVARALLDGIATRVQEALDEATELAQRVYPPLLDARWLASALRFAAESAGVAVLIDVTAGADYPFGITAAVYWSWVDALSSASRGSEATASVHDADGALTFELSIAERLDEDRVDRLRDRIEAFDGRVSVDDRPDGGARVHGWMPLSR